MKIFVWGNNYVPDNKERQETFSSQEPYLYLKPDSSVLKDGKPFFLPDFSDDVRAGVECVVKISRLGKSIPPRFASRYYNEVTVGVNFVACDLRERFEIRREPWDLAVGFDNSAVLGKFAVWPEEEHGKNLRFRLEINGKPVQQGETSRMRQSIEEGIAGLSGYYTLKIGDLIYTGSPSEESVQIRIGDHLEGYLEEEKLLDFYVR